MAGLLMMITDAGLDALVDAEGGGSDDIVITELDICDGADADRTAWRVQAPGVDIG